MKQVAFLLLLSFAFILNLNAQNKKQQDQDAIKKMCGCFDVTFNFAETFEYSKDSTYVPSETKHEGALELAILVEDTDNKIVIQHLLVVGPPANQMVVKHWRQDWQFENTNLYQYNHDDKWNYVSLPKADVKGQWTQKVFQVDDSPRYEGSSSWVHVDGKSYWENTTDAPLARRELTTRSDYNVLTRTNRHEITKTGWIHDQDNDKIIRADGKEDVLLAQEKGYNTYVKVDDSKCKAAQDFWTKESARWSLVRTKWNDIFSRNKDLALEVKVDNKDLFRYLSDEKDYKTAKEINPLIESFVKK